MDLGRQPQTPPPAQLLCVLSSVRSDYLEVVHLLHVRLSLHLSIFYLGLGLGGSCPARLLCLEYSDGLNAGEPQAPSGTWASLPPPWESPPPSLMLEPGGGGTSSVWSLAKALRGTKGLTAQRDGRSRVAGGSSKAAERGQSCQKDVEISGRSPGQVGKSSVDMSQESWELVELEAP